MQIAVRHLESVIRIAESYAKMRLSPVVSSQDVDRAINLMLESYLQSQKHGLAKQQRKIFKQYILQTEDEILMNILHRLFKERKQFLGGNQGVPVELFR